MPALNSRGLHKSVGINTHGSLIGLLSVGSIRLKAISADVTFTACDPLPLPEGTGTGKPGCPPPT